MNDIFWLKELKKRFLISGMEHRDLYDLLTQAIVRNRTTFPAFIYDASRGEGVSVGEGYYYALDQEWDDPEKFDEVSFFLGEMESSSIGVADYVALMEIAADVYVNNFPEERGRVQGSVNRLKERYSRFLD